jgi:hypothetical protein
MNFATFTTDGRQYYGAVAAGDVVEAEGIGTLRYTVADEAI